MTQFFKVAALFLVIACIVWIAVLWHWESTHRNITIVEVVVYLGALPVALFALLLALRWAWRGATPRRDAALAAAAAAAVARAPASSPAEAATTNEDAQRQATVQLLGAFVATAAGVEPADLLAAAAQNKPRPEFDTDLLDAEGLGVMCARLKDLQPEELGTQLEPLLQTLKLKRPEWASLEISEQALRALAALAEPLQNALRALQPWAHLLGAPVRDADAAAPAPPRATASAPPRVRLLLGWPADWTDFEREAATAWVRFQVPDHSGIAPARFVVATHTGSGEELWLKADQVLHMLAREGRSGVVLVTACHSDLSDAAVANLERQQRLFSAQRNPKGVMPGEAAAALLLANDDWPAAPDGDVPPMRLHRPAVMRRDKSVEALGRVSSQCLQDAATQALAAARVGADTVTALVCDADQHTQRGTELFGATLAMLPQLDPSEDLRLVGTVTAHTGAVNVLLVVAAAAQRARADDKPCLGLCVGDPFMRLALLARPAASATDAAAPPPAA